MNNGVHIAIIGAGLGGIPAAALLQARGKMFPYMNKRLNLRDWERVLILVPI